ncbi:MAG: DUF116 domain-containing protein [Candidatus Altiarchaeota archaeon]
MDLPVFELTTLHKIGLATIILAGTLFVSVVSLSLLGVFLALVYRRNNRIMLPNITLFILGFLEAPVKQMSWLFGIDGIFIDTMVVELRNILYAKAYASTNYPERVIFLPQCMRNPKCPAPLGSEGIKCISCGRCGIFKIKEYSEQLGYRFFIAPGSMLVKRMVKKYKPKAVLGVGCVLEVYEGSSLMADAGLPVQAVILERDGCVDTRVNVIELMGKIRAHKSLGKKYSINNDPELFGLAESISQLWDSTHPSDIQLSVAKEKSEKRGW